MTLERGTYMGASMTRIWNPKQAQLREALSDAKRFDEAIKLCLELHGIVHSRGVSGLSRPTYYDEIWDGLSREAFVAMPTPKDATIAWNIWHIARIEDITANLLIRDGKQIMDDTWLKRLGVNVRDTGNAMTDEEITDFSRRVDMDALRRYRDAVGTRTRDILSSLEPQDLKRKIKPESLARILREGGVSEHKDSIWLLDFWGRKNVAGILLMPITRHQIVHLNDSMRLKMKING